MEMKNFDFSKKIFYHPERIIAYKEGKNPFAITCEIDLTNLCNHDCHFCDSRASRTMHKDSLTKEIAISVLGQMKHLGLKGVSFTGGGEPLVHKDFREILGYAKSIGLDTGLITNGALLNDFDFIVRNLNWIRVSISAGNRELYKKFQGKDDFDKVISNVITLLNCKKENHYTCNIGVRMFMNEDNLTTLPMLTDIFYRTSLNYIQVAPDDRSHTYNLHDIPGASKVLVECENKLKGNGIKLLGAGFTLNRNLIDIPTKCYASNFLTVVTADGSMRFCKTARTDDTFIVGNLYKNTVADIWNGAKMKELVCGRRPGNCALLCKHLPLNVSLEQILNPGIDDSPSFIG